MQHRQVFTIELSLNRLVTFKENGRKDPTVEGVTLLHSLKTAIRAVYYVAFFLVNSQPEYNP